MKPFRRPRPTLSIADPWEEANAFLRAELGLVGPVALAFLALPATIADLYGSTPAGLDSFVAAILLLVSWAFELFGTVAIAILALKPGLSVAEALRASVRRLPSSVGIAGILFGVLVVLVVPIAPYLALPGHSAAAPGGLIATYMLLLAIALMVLGVRLSLANMVVAAEGAGPVAALTRSLRLTRGVGWRLLGFMLLFMLFGLIVMLATNAGLGSLVTMVGRLLDQEAAARVLVSLLSAVVGAGLTAWLIVVLARIYARLAGWNDGT